MQDARHHAPATARNREAIFAVLNPLIPKAGRVLEIASGSGEHGCFFCQERKDILWQASDPSPESLASIMAWKDFCGLQNLADPWNLDVQAAWPKYQFDIVVCINMIHIAPWEACLALLAGASEHLVPDGYLYLYGPFLEDEIDTAPSNLAFDESLRIRDQRWGIRRKELVVAAAKQAGFELIQRVAMPANNLSLVFRLGKAEPRRLTTWTR